MRQINFPIVLARHYQTEVDSIRKHMQHSVHLLLIATFLVAITLNLSATLISDQTLSILDAKTKVEMQTFAKDTMAAAPASVRNGTDLEKAKYLCNEMCKSFAAKKITVNASHEDMVRHADPTDYTCGDLTERVKTVWVAAGIKSGSAIDIIADKNSWKPAALDRNLNHGAPALIYNGQVYIFDLWQHAVANGKEFSQFDASQWNSMTPSAWEVEMHKQKYVRFSTNGGYDYQDTVKEALEPMTSGPKAKSTSGGKPLLGIFDGKVSVKLINEDLYLNQGTAPATDDAAKKRNESIRQRNKIMLDNTKPNLMQIDKNTIKLELMYFSDNDKRFKAGDTPDVSLTITGMLNVCALGTDGYIVTPDPQKRVKVETTADSFKVVKTETAQDASGNVNIAYTIRGNLQGNKMTGTWTTTHNGKDYMRGDFTADATLKVNSKGFTESVK